MIKNVFAIFPFLVLITLVACTNSPASTKPLPGIDISSEKINTSIQLIDDPVLMNSHKNGDLLSLHLINLSNKKIIFPSDFGIKLFVWDGKNWIGNIQNRFFPSDFSYSLPTSKEYPLGEIVNAAPFLDISDIPGIIRVVVVGHTQNNEADQVAAYLDIKIIP